MAYNMRRARAHAALCCQCAAHALGSEARSAFGCAQANRTPRQVDLGCLAALGLARRRGQIPNMHVRAVPGSGSHFPDHGPTPTGMALRRRMATNPQQARTLIGTGTPGPRQLALVRIRVGIHAICMFMRAAD